MPGRMRFTLRLLPRLLRGQHNRFPDGFLPEGFVDYSMIRLQTLRQIAVVLFVLAFLADAINVDEIIGLTSFDRDDDPDVVDNSTILNSSLTENLLKSLSLSSVTPTSQETKLELVDVDSPSLEAVYVSRDKITPFIQKSDIFVVPVSASTELNFYSLCKLQI